MVLLALLAEGNACELAPGIRLMHPFYELTAPATGDSVSFSVARWPSSTAHWVGRDAEGRPAILLEVDASGFGDAPPVALRNLRIDHAVEVKVQHADVGTVAGRMTVVRCLSNSEQLTKYFLDIADRLVSRLGDVPTPADILSAVRHLQALFLPMRQPAAITVQGLWAELLVIAESRSPKRMLRCWRVTDTDRYDFNDGQLRLEVKSCSTSLRAHIFSQRQMELVPSAQTMVASLLIEETAAGTSLEALYERVLAFGQLCGQDERVQVAVARLLGESRAAAMSSCYDQELAMASLRFYKQEDLPRLPGPIPDAIDSIQFRILMDRVPHVLSKEMVALGGLFESSVPSA